MVAQLPDEPLCPEPDGVLRRLGELQTPLPVLRESIRRGFLAGDFVYAAHARTYRGLKIYHEINGELRAEFALRAWSFNDDDNIPRAIRPDDQVILTALSGNSRTGLYGENAQTRRPRGQAGIRIVHTNAQLSLIDLLDEDDRERFADSVVLPAHTWFLLYCRGGDVIRSELSLAHGVTDDGGLLVWAERLILPEFNLYDGDGGRSALPDSGPPAPDVDVPVIRRSA